MISVRNVVLSALTAAAALPVAAVAQERQPQSRPRIFVDGGNPQVIRNKIRMVTQRRARLGVTVDLQASANDSVGATIELVTPGGPAAKAGIKSGDIITKLDGKSLVAGDAKKASDEQSMPGLRLVEIASQLKPDDTVSVEYRREGARKTTSLITGNEPMMMEMFGDPGSPDPQGVISKRIERMMPRGGNGNFQFGPGETGFSFAFGGPLMDLQLAPLNADLGQYFGTAEGVLVIDVPKESTLGLKGGDVILNVDGRKATSPGSLLRILRSYDPGDSFKLEIMRNKSHLTVTGKLPKSHEE